MDLSPFILTIIWNLIISLWIIFIVFIIKYIKNYFIKYIDYLTALTVGLLLWLIFLWFIPELVSSQFSWEQMWIFILLGIILFYLLELFLHWHHCKDLDHNLDCNSSHAQEHKNWILMFVVTMLHNSFHWVILFVAFSVNFNFWVATTIAVLLHSIPLNIANYLMNKDNIKYSYFAALGGVFGAILTFPFADFLVSKESYILSLISWWLLYTALTDIFPEFKWRGNINKKIWYLIFIVIWIWIFQLLW